MIETEDTTTETQDFHPIDGNRFSNNLLNRVTYRSGNEFMVTITGVTLLDMQAMQEETSTTPLLPTLPKQQSKV